MSVSFVQGDRISIRVSCSSLVSFVLSTFFPAVLSLCCTLGDFLRSVSQFTISKLIVFSL